MREQLPIGWVQVTLGEIAKWGSGGTPSRSNPNYYGGDIPWVKTGDLGSKILSIASEFITTDGLQNSSAKIFPKGSVAIAMYGATIGKTSILDIDASTNQACAVAIPLQGIDKIFTYYLLNNEKENFIKKGKGGAQPNISQEILKAHSIQLPPLNEQIRIANKLDSLLAKVDTAQARLEKIPTLLKRFRQSVLAAATSGELTREWREEKGASFEDWDTKTINDITTKCFDGPFGSKLKTADYTTQGVKVARLENIGHLKFLHEKETFISEEKFRSLINNKLEDMDILFSSFIDEEVRACIFQGKLGVYVNKADCFCLRADVSQCLPEFLVLKLACRSTYEKVKSQVHGATRPRINLKFLKSLTLDIPSVDEQTEIVRRVESLFALADTVEKQYLAAKQRLDRLSQSLLAKAFRGELVPQDPNDEPAAELLKRIQAERQAQPAAKQKRSKPA